MGDGRELKLFFEDAAELAGDEELPKYSDVGRILVRVEPPTGGYDWDYEALDSDGCTFWIMEGEGWDYWLDNNADFTGPGVYVVEGITGVYHRGDWSAGDDDDVSWSHTGIRPATAEEIESEALS